MGSSVTAVKHLVLQSQPLLCNLCQCVIDELRYTPQGKRLKLPGNICVGRRESVLFIKSELYSFI